MRKTLAALAAGLLTLSALPATASAPPQARPYSQERDRDHDRGRNDQRGDRNDRGDRGRNNDRYGRWDDRWGARPSTPPRHWTRQNDWYRHVRACQSRYRSYDPRTDTFTVRRGVVQRCRL